MGVPVVADPAGREVTIRRHFFGLAAPAFANATLDALVNAAARFDCYRATEASLFLNPIWGLPATNEKGAYLGTHHVICS